MRLKQLGVIKVFPRGSHRTLNDDIHWAEKVKLLLWRGRRQRGWKKKLMTIITPPPACTTPLPPMRDGREPSQRRPVIASNSCLFRSTAMRVSKLLWYSYISPHQILWLDHDEALLYIQVQLQLNDLPIKSSDQFVHPDLCSQAFLLILMMSSIAVKSQDPGSRLLDRLLDNVGTVSVIFDNHFHPHPHYNYHPHQKDLCQHQIHDH